MRDEGIEPPFQVWKTRFIPLEQSRMVCSGGISRPSIGLQPSVIILYYKQFGSPARIQTGGSGFKVQRIWSDYSTGVKPLSGIEPKSSAYKAVRLPLTP